MQATVADVGSLRKKLTVTYTKAEVEARRQKVLRQLAGEVKLDGFRPGKSSQAIVQKRFGAAADSKAREELADEGFREAVKNNNLKPIGPIENGDVVNSDGLSISASFDVKPAIKVPDPKSITIANPEIVISAAELDEALGGLLRRAGALSPLSAEETIIEDDSATLSGTITVDGKEVRKLHDFHHLVGGYALFGKPSAEVLKAFADKKIGDQITFTTTLPASFAPAEAANKEAQVSVTIQAVQRQRAAEANDDFAKKMGLDTLDTLKDRLRDQLKQNRELQQHRKQLDELTEALLQTVSVDFPAKLLENVHTAADARVVEAEKAGKPADEITKLKTDGKADAEKGLKRYLILDALAEAFAIEVSRSDLENQIQLAAQQSGRKPQEIADNLASSGQINQVVGEIREAKTLEALLDKVLGREAQAASAQ